MIWRIIHENEFQFQFENRPCQSQHWIQSNVHISTNEFWTQILLTIRLTEPHMLGFMLYRENVWSSIQIRVEFFHDIIWFGRVILLHIDDMIDQVIEVKFQRLDWQIDDICFDIHERKCILIDKWFLIYHRRDEVFDETNIFHSMDMHNEVHVQDVREFVIWEKWSLKIEFETTMIGWNTTTEAKKCFELHNKKAPLIRCFLFYAVLFTYFWISLSKSFLL